MSFTFKELLKHSNKKQKKKQKKQKEEEDGDDQIALGPFPASVHKLWSLRQRGWEPAPGPTLLPARGGAIAVCLTIVDRFPHEDFWRRWLAGGGSNDPRGRIGRMHFHAKHPERVSRAKHPCYARSPSLTTSFSHSFLAGVASLLLLLRRCVLLSRGSVSARWSTATVRNGTTSKWHEPCSRSWRQHYRWALAIPRERSERSSSTSAPSRASPLCHSPRPPTCCGVRVIPRTRRSEGDPSSTPGPPMRRCTPCCAAPRSLRSSRSLAS